MIRHGAVASRLLLPTQNTLLGVANQGWRVATEIRPSLLPGAGNGRFAAEPIAAGALIMVKPMLSVASLESLRAVPPDTTLTFSGPACLERYVELNREEGDYTRAQVLSVLEHFLWSLDGVHGCLNASTWTVNHAGSLATGLNMHLTLEQLDDGRDAVVGRAMGAGIALGEEVRNNYEDFIMPRFYLDFCHAEGFKDVRTAVLEAVAAAGSA
jgi:hypothetical protein